MNAMIDVSRRKVILQPHGDNEGRMQHEGVRDDSNDETEVLLMAIVDRIAED